MFPVVNLAESFKNRRRNVSANCKIYSKVENIFRRASLQLLCLGRAGFTGILLTLQFFLIFIFSMQYARRHTFRAFWIVHLSYPIYFILMLLHGSGRMIQAAYTYYFVLGPIILFTIDQLISVSRRKIEIPVVSAKLLPSGLYFLQQRTIAIDHLGVCQSVCLSRQCMGCVKTVEPIDVLFGLKTPWTQNVIRCL